MATIIDDRVTVPDGLTHLSAFHRWVHSVGFPQSGRIDFVAGSVEVDLSPEELFTHGAPKGEIASVLYGLVKRRRLGRVFIDRTRVSSEHGSLSTEPDVVFVSSTSLRDRVALVPKLHDPSGHCFIEIQGPVDLVVEIVSDSSERKDYERLPAAYFAAGVAEYWLVDGRADPLRFTIHTRGTTAFRPADPDDRGFQSSAILGCRFQLRREVGEDGYWDYTLAVGGETDS
jgi:Uma2 family endonuclease